MFEGRKKYRCVWLMLLLILFISTACSKEKEEESLSETVYINGEKLLDADSVLLMENDCFLRLSILNRYVEMNPKLRRKCDLTHFVNLNDLNISEELKALFYHPKAVIFSLPLIKRQGEDYIDVRYLVDFYGFKKLDFPGKILLFSPSYDKSPNSVGLLKQGSEITIPEEGRTLRLSQAEEVYFFEEEGGEEVKFYSASSAPAICKINDLEYISNYMQALRSYEPKTLKHRYNKYLMAFDDINFYSDCLEMSPVFKFDGLSALMPTTLSLQRARLISKQALSYMDAAFAMGCDVLPVLDIYSDEEGMQLLKDDFSAKSIADSLLLHALYYGYSGLDINLINLRDKDIEVMAPFLSKLSNKYKSAGLSFFLNLYPNQVSLYRLGLEPPVNTAVDCYIAMLMDGTLGTYAAYPTQKPSWVEGELRELLKKLPPEKVILAQGLYVRSYEFGPSGGESIAQSVFPASEFYSKTDGLIMESRRDEEMDQVYYRYKNPDTKGYFELWMDDEKSYARKFKLVRTHNLEGIALWTYAMINDDTVNLIKKVLFSD